MDAGVDSLDICGGYPVIPPASADLHELSFSHFIIILSTNNPHHFIINTIKNKWRMLLCSHNTGIHSPFKESYNYLKNVFYLSKLTGEQAKVIVEKKFYL